MNTMTLSSPVGRLDTQAAASEQSRLIKGVAVGLLAASIGALYTVVARWGIVNGLQSPDLTVLRFGVAGIIVADIAFGMATRQKRIARSLESMGGNFSSRRNALRSLDVWRVATSTF